MARLIKEEPVPLPVENRYKHGLVHRYLEIGKFELWIRWFFTGWIWNTNKFTWSETKQLAREGKLASLTYAGACLHPLWTNHYILK